MDILSKHLIALLERMYNQEGQNEESQLVRDQFKAMENRFHTWMNYYSLFNGALLVAYCTLIVSTGIVIQLKYSIQTIYKLECGYWGLLAVIAFLGVVASFCWFLSMKGHNCWLNNWRRKLQRRYPDIMKDISGDDSFTSQLVTSMRGKRVLPGFYSTFEITKVFIGTVITIWVMVFIHALSKYVGCNLSIIRIGAISFFIVLILYLLRHFLYICLGSNLNGFSINGQAVENEEGIRCEILRNFLCASGCHIIKVALLFLCIIVFFLFLSQDYCIRCFLNKIGNALICCCQ